jgi:eukaryotic-like serine/threonine-protein kinase
MEKFGRYQLQEKLGQGGMGVVYRAFDTVLERIVALKLVLTPDGLDSEMRERFFREARAAGHLSHKNVVTIYDLGEHEGKPYLAMEYLDGEDLQRRLARPERMSLSHKLRLAIEICEGVEYAHSHGVIHRDLKPANIYITESGGAKILDFGLARLITSQLTKSNMFMGTMNYMAPEQVRGERADQRSDVFSVGVVLYELLGGRKAFEGDSVASTLYKILQETPEPLAKIDPAVPQELAAIVERTLAKLRDERYPDISALRRDLEAYRELRRASGPTTPMPMPVSAPSIAGPARIAQPDEAPGSGAGPRPVHGTGTRLSGRSVAIAASAILVAAAGAWFVVDRSRRPESAPGSAATMRAEDPIAARLRGAQQAFDARQYRAALSGAEAVLLQAPQNAEAQRIRGAARQAAVEDALQRGTRHLKNSETSDAIKAAGEALALAPDNADARHILEQAGARTSAPDAETARRRMTEARAAADAAGARTHAAPAFNKALRAGQDADRLHKAQRFADAASRYYEASGLYHGAEVAARSSASALEAAARTASAPQPAPEPAAPPVTIPAPTPAPPPPVAAPVSPPIPAAPPAAAPTPAPAPEAVLPVAGERINELIGRYKEALESRSLDQLRRLWPSLSGAAENAIRQEFRQATRITVEIGEPRISVSGGSGTATFIRKYTVVTVEGQQLQSTTQAAMDVRRIGSSWVIDAIRFSPR